MSKRILSGCRHLAQAIVAALMAAMFLTFVLQIFVRYSARLPWISETFPMLEPSRFGWTLEFCLLLWVWLVFFGNAFVVRRRDHVIFDILLNHVRPSVRRWFVIIAGVFISVALLLSVEPTWANFHILRLKKTATLGSLLGDTVRMRDLYSVYIVFLVAVSFRFAWTAYKAIRLGVEDPEATAKEPRIK